MDKYEKLILALISIAVLSSFIYLIAIIAEFIAPEFPYGIFLPSYAVILIALIAHRRLDKKENKSF
ncbi:MAG: hypothetical protein ACFFEY_12650 [Candidatus Thorarchaeota archaeon]